MTIRKQKLEAIAMLYHLIPDRTSKQWRLDEITDHNRDGENKITLEGTIINDHDEVTYKVTFTVTFGALGIVSLFSSVATGHAVMADIMAYLTFEDVHHTFTAVYRGDRVGQRSLALWEALDSLEQARTEVDSPLITTDLFATGLIYNDGLGRESFISFMDIEEWWNHHRFHLLNTGRMDLDTQRVIDLSSWPSRYGEGQSLPSSSETKAGLASQLSPQLWPTVSHAWATFLLKH